jgi:hypothetical protein
MLKVLEAVPQKSQPSLRFLGMLPKWRQMLERKRDDDIVCVHYVGAIFGNKAAETRLKEHLSSLGTSGASLLWTFVGGGVCGDNAAPVARISHSRVVFPPTTIRKIVAQFPDHCGTVAGVAEAVGMAVCCGMSHQFGLNQVGGGDAWSGRTFRCNIIVQARARLYMMQNPSVKYEAARSVIRDMRVADLAPYDRDLLQWSEELGELTMGPLISAGCRFAGQRCAAAEAMRLAQALAKGNYSECTVPSLCFATKLQVDQLEAKWTNCTSVWARAMLAAATKWHADRTAAGTASAAAEKTPLERALAKGNYSECTVPSLFGATKLHVDQLEAKWTNCTSVWARAMLAAATKWHADRKAGGTAFAAAEKTHLERALAKGNYSECTVPSLFGATKLQVDQLDAKWKNRTSVWARAMLAAVTKYRTGKKTVANRAGGAAKKNRAGWNDDIDQQLESWVKETPVTFRGYPNWRRIATMLLSTFNLTKSPKQIRSHFKGVVKNRPFHAGGSPAAVRPPVMYSRSHALSLLLFHTLTPMYRPFFNIGSGDVEEASPRREEHCHCAPSTSSRAPGAAPCACGPGRAARCAARSGGNGGRGGRAASGAARWNARVRRGRGEHLPTD